VIDALPLEAKALVVLAIYLTPFFLIGWLGQRAANWWMGRKGLDVSGPPRDEPGGGRRRLFLLGSWRNEGGS